MKLPGRYPVPGLAVTWLTGEGAWLTVLTGNSVELCGVVGTVLDERGGDRSSVMPLTVHLLYDCFFSFFFTCLRIVPVPSVGQFFKLFFLGHMRTFGARNKRIKEEEKKNPFAS